MTSFEFGKKRNEAFKKYKSEMLKTELFTECPFDCWSLNLVGTIYFYDVILLDWRVMYDEFNELISFDELFGLVNEDIREKLAWHLNKFV